MFNISSKYLSFFNNKPLVSWVAHITRDFLTDISVCIIVPWYNLIDLFHRVIYTSLVVWCIDVICIVFKWRSILELCNLQNRICITFHFRKMWILYYFSPINVLLLSHEILKIKIWHLIILYIYFSLKARCILE